MKTDTIYQLMIRDHKRLSQLLSDVENSIEGSKDSLKDAFDLFQWNVEKHFFVEERAIFIYLLPYESRSESRYFDELMDQHSKIQDKLKTVKENLSNSIGKEVQGLKELLQDHQNFEEGTIYPLIDREIDESEKQYISDRINEIRI